MAETSDGTAIVVVDTREVLPYTFQTPSVRGTLKTGDYSLVDFEDKISIERKEKNDLIGCLSSGRDRFKRELVRGTKLGYFALVVEASLSDIVTGNYRSRMNPKSVVQSLISFSVKYRLPIFFADNRLYAQRLTESLLLKFYREIKKSEETC